MQRHSSASPVTVLSRQGLRKDIVCQCAGLGTGENYADSANVIEYSPTHAAQWSEDVVPTVAFNFRKVRKGNVTLKIWDVAGA